MSETEEIPQTDHPICLRCHRGLKDPRWRKLGYGRKCYALTHQGVCQCQSEPVNVDTYESASPLIKEPTEAQLMGRQDRTPDPKISKAEKRAALDAALQEEMARPNPEPSEAQRKAAEQRLLADVDNALGGDRDGEEETSKDSEDAEEEHPKQRKRIKAPKGQVLVREGAFNRSSRSMIVNGRNPESEN